MIDPYSPHVATTLNLVYDCPSDLVLSSGLAQMSEMLPAADNDFKYKSYQKGGKTNVANKVSIHDPKHREALLVKGMTIGSKQCLDMILIILETPERVSLVGISGGNNYNFNMELATQLHKLVLKC